LRPRSYIPNHYGKAIAEARKFVLDEAASAFLSDLSHASYAQSFARSVSSLEDDAGYEKCERHLADIADKTRQLSRLPHATTWVEYNGVAFRKRTREVYKDAGAFEAMNKFLDDDMKKHVPGIENPSSDDEEDLAKAAPQLGWLLKSYDSPSGGIMFSLHAFANAFGANKVKIPVIMPFAYVWTTDNTIPAVPSTIRSMNEDVSDGFLATGIRGYDSPHVVLAGVPDIIDLFEKDTLNALVVEYMGELRYVWALLAAVNDIPVGVKHVVPSKGYFARGKYRKYSEHSVISILIPKGRDPTVVARKIVAMSRKRAHLVRGFWRRNWRKPLAPMCDHVLQTGPDGDLVCRHCGGEKFWVDEHQRGDASLGFVLHDYKIQHEEPAS